MHTMTTTLQSVPGSRLYQSAPINEPKMDRELDKDWEVRCWRKRLHVNPDGLVYIPPSAFKNSLNTSTRYQLVKIPGQGNRTFAKHIISGIMVILPLVLPIKAEEVEGEWLFVPSDGKPGGGKRVWKCFPVISEWGGVVEFQIIDDILSESIVLQHLETSGQSVGIGAFRPENRGWSGRFTVVDSKWQ